MKQEGDKNGMFNTDTVRAGRVPGISGRGIYQRAPSKWQIQMQEESVEDWQMEKILTAIKGRMTPDRAYVVEELNRKRRKEGIYAKTKIKR